MVLLVLLEGAERVDGCELRLCEGQAKAPHAANERGNHDAFTAFRNQRHQAVAQPRTATREHMREHPPHPENPADKHLQLGR